MNVLHRIWSAWKEIASSIGDFQARWLLTAFYFTVAMPFGLLARWMDALRIRRAPTESAWTLREEATVDAAAAKRQF
jgi:hypothetical protein